MPARLEHINFTVPDPDKTAAWLCDLFGWKVRWAGSAIHGGRSVHVGSDTDYLAIYSGEPGRTVHPNHASYNQVGGFNHVGIVVDDLDATEKKVRALGFEPVNHADYEPGRRFYFRDEHNIEYEIVSYD